MRYHSMGHTIGAKHESQDLYYLTSPNSSTTCPITDSSILINSRWGRLSLCNRQKLYLDCLVCPHYIVSRVNKKHTHATFLCGV